MKYLFYFLLLMHITEVGKFLSNDFLGIFK
jgi:hypothetical protein